MADEYKFPPSGAFKLPPMTVVQLTAGDVEGSLHIVFQTQFKDQTEPLTLVAPVTLLNAASLAQMLAILQGKGVVPVLTNPPNA
jgi:hypothetical protein